MTRTHRFLRGFVSGYVHMAAATIAGLWLTPFFLHHLGQNTYGLWLVGTQVVAYLLLMDLGVVALLPRETAYVTGRTGRQDHPELRLLVARALTLAVLQTPLVLAAAVLALFWLPESWAPLRGPLAAVLGLFVLTFPLRVFQAVLTGLQDLAFVARVQFAAWAAGTFATILLVVQGLGLLSLAAGWCATQVVLVSACGVRLARAFPGAVPQRLAFDDLRSVRGYMTQSLWISVGQVSQVLLNGSDVLVIAAVLGPAAAVPYACTGKLISVLANQPLSVLQGAAPALSELRSSADRTRMFGVSAALAQATLALSGLVVCIVLALNAGFVRWWVGADQYGGAMLTLLLLAAMLARHVNTTNVYALFCFGHERRLALTGLADGLVAFVATYLLVSVLGIAGAPLGVLAGVLLISGPSNLRALSRETGVPSARFVTTLFPWLVRFGAVACVAAAAGLLLQPSSFVRLTMLGVLIVIVYLGAVVTPLLASPAGVYLTPVLVSLRRWIPYACSAASKAALSVTR